MPTTPPPRSLRARTPPTPMHGDNYEPYSPRRSSRKTAQSNPYSSQNTDRSPNASFQHRTTPPASIKKTRFARAPTQLSSPPSSPASPVNVNSHKTPRKQLFTPAKSNARREQSFTSRASATPKSILSRKTTTSQPALSDSDGPSTNSLAPPTTILHPTTMLPTPSKTPKKRPAAAMTARILDFQPQHPNDAMPTPRQRKKRARANTAANGFELYEEYDAESGDIAIYTDNNARVPEVDESEDNPFIGPRKTQIQRARPQRRSKKSPEEIERDQRIEEAVRRDEGVTYVFRGKKIFRRFASEDEASGDNDEGDLSASPEQRRLQRLAGASASRPLTRSAIKPRLLFPSEEQLREREAQQNGDDDVDEEAATDIEVPIASPEIKNHQQPVSPPSTKKGQRVVSVITEDDGEIETEVSSAGTKVKRAGKTTSPFDSWQRTKKRAGDSNDGSVSGKRSRSGASAS